MGVCARHLPHGSKRKREKKKKRKEGNLPFVITKTINCESSIQFTNTLCCLIRSGNAAALGILYTMLGPVLPSSLSFFLLLFFFLLFLFFPQKLITTGSDTQQDAKLFNRRKLVVWCFEPRQAQAYIRAIAGSKARIRPHPKPFLLCHKTEPQCLTACNPMPQFKFVLKLRHCLNRNEVQSACAE